jgi:hypothetical protein
MATDWKFVTPRGHLTLFYFGSLGGSRRYNFMQVLSGTSLETYFPLMPGAPVLGSIPRKQSSVEYTLKAFAQVTGTSKVTQSGIDATSVPSTKPGDQEWLLQIQDDEGKEIQISLLITPVDPAHKPVSGDGRLVYKTKTVKSVRKPSKGKRN